MPNDISEMIKVRMAPEGAAPVDVFTVEVVHLGGETRVDTGAYDFGDFTASLERLTKSLHESIKRISPTKASVEFGVEVGVDSGKLTALLVQGTGKANLKVTLEWS
jgi:hypothetical protein